MISNVLNKIILGAFTLDSKVSANELGNQAVSKFTVPIRVIGGLFIVFAIAAVAFGLILSSKKPEERSAIMSRMPWIAGGSALLGSLVLVAQYIFNI